MKERGGKILSADFRDNSDETVSRGGVRTLNEAAMTVLADGRVRTATKVSQVGSCRSESRQSWHGSCSNKEALEPSE